MNGNPVLLDDNVSPEINAVKEKKKEFIKSDLGG